eukprot:7681626-Alexandrium_andersonii.AAC.1
MSEAMWGGPVGHLVRTLCAHGLEISPEFVVSDNVAFRLDLLNGQHQRIAPALWERARRWAVDRA